jgi:hypothetical protein
MGEAEAGSTFKVLRSARGFSRTSADGLQFQDRSSESGRRVLTGGLSKREAFGVRSACRRFRSACGESLQWYLQSEKREQAPRTPYASRHLCTCHIDNSSRTPKGVQQF